MLDDVRDTFGIRCWKVALFVRADPSEEPILVLLLLGINLKRGMSSHSSGTEARTVIISPVDMPISSSRSGT